MDSPHTVGNGFTCQEKRPSSKLTSVLEAVAGEYALVINGHSLVSVPVRRGGGLPRERFSPHGRCACFVSPCPLLSRP